MEQRSEKAKQEFVKNKEVLATQVKLAGNDEMAYDDLTTDITELFLSGEAITRDKESVGSSSRALTVMFWNLGNWQRGNNWKVPSNLEYQKLFYKENKPDDYPFHVPENNNLFLQMAKNLRANIILNYEATTLVPFRQYMEDHGWTLCFNDVTDLCCLARLGVGGSIRQIGGPQEKSQEDIWSGPKRRVSFAIYEIVWGKAVAREAFSASSQTGFSIEDDQDLTSMTRARMPVTRVCTYHVNNAEAGKSHSISGECLAHMMYECAIHQVSVIGGDANKMAYQKQGQQRNASYGMSTFQFWLDRMEQTINQCFKKQLPDAVHNMNVRQFHSISFLDLLDLRRKSENVVNVDPRVREETQYVGDCCTLTFFEFGLSMERNDFSDRDLADDLEYKYKVNEELFYLTNDILLLKEKDTDSHCPILVSIEPAEMSRQERRSFLHVESKKRKAGQRKEYPNARKAKGKAKPGI